VSVPFTAAAALAAAVSVSVAVGVVACRRCRRLEREAVAQRLVAGCEARDNAALHAQLVALRYRLERESARDAVLAEADLVLDEVLARLTRIDPMEGGL
jgi:anti-sigma factor ChrR (cupin superfamily)